MKVDPKWARVCKNTLAAECVPHTQGGGNSVWGGDSFPTQTAKEASWKWLDKLLNHNSFSVGSSWLKAVSVLRSQQHSLQSTWTLVLWCLPRLWKGGRGPVESHMQKEKAFLCSRVFKSYKRQVSDLIWPVCWLCVCGGEFMCGSSCACIRTTVALHS